MKKIGILLLATILLNSVSWTQNNGPKADTAEQVIKRVKKAEFNKFMAKNSNCILIDVRTPQEYKRGTIASAINIDYNSSNFKSEISKLDKSKPILLFCQSGGRSARALKIFESLGFQYVLELEGGYSQY